MAARAMVTGKWWALPNIKSSYAARSALKSLNGAASAIRLKSAMRPSGRKKNNQAIANQF